MEHVIYRDGDQPDPLSTTPLEGLETKVLEVWKQTPAVAKAYQANPEQVENAVRRAVFDVLRQEAELRAEGLQAHEAQEFTRPPLWEGADVFDDVTAAASRGQAPLHFTISTVSDAAD